MKSAKTIALWLLEHLTFGPDREALCGDLLEQLHGGRSNSWFWREVFTAIGLSALRVVNRFAMSAVFSAGWSALYPAWALWGPSRFSPAILSRSSVLDWPLSSMASVTQGILPIITFVWLGLSAFLILRKDLLPRISIFQLLNGLSCSLSVLLVEVLFLPKPPVCRMPNCIAQPDFFSRIHLSAINAPLAISVFVAILCVLPPEQYPPRRRRRSRSSQPKTLRPKWQSEITHPA